MRNAIHRLSLAALAITALAVPVHAKETAAPATPALPEAEPAAVGLAAEALAKVRETVKAQIERGQVHDVTVAIARHGKLAFLESFGDAKDDSIFRIYSMSKPITSVAVMQLVEQGTLKLDEPISTYLPEFKTVKTQAGEAPKRAPTVRDVLRHTAGFTYGFFGNTPVDQAYRKAQILDKTKDLDVFSKKLAGLPLLHEPGTRWHYSVGVDLLGRLVEVAAKQPFDAYLQEKIFAPLGMTDTAFHVPDAKATRLLPNRTVGGAVIDAPETSEYRIKPALFSGGGGLVSTARDYMRFALMLHGDGALGHVRILKAETVKGLRTQHVPKEALPLRFGMMSIPGLGFGLGVSVRTDAIPGASKGEYGWSGAASTTWFNAPEHDLCVIVLTQRMPLYIGLDQALRPHIHAALTEPAPVTTPAGK